MIDLFFLNHSGFAPTLPTGSRWGRLGPRLVVPYEAPEGRRINAVGALAPYDPAQSRGARRGGGAPRLRPPVGGTG